MKTKILYILLFLCFFFIKLKAQDTLQINEVIKTASLQDIFKNSNDELIDSTLQQQYKNSSIDEILAIQTSSQIKSYGGLGNLSSINLRGSGANHTSINWNGFVINSATSGGTDLSLIQTGFFNEIKLIPGASSSLYGSGTFGGALELNNLYNFNQGFNLKIGSEIGSFETYKYFAGASFSGKNFSYKISANKVNAENNFPFFDKYKFDNPFEKRQNNSLNSFNIIQNFKLKLPKNNTFESGIWYLIKDKEIPEIAGSYIAGNKMQTDSIFRTYIRHKKLGKKHLLTESFAFFSEYLHYTDKINDYDTEFYIDSKIKANNYFGDISYRYYLNNKLTFDFAGIINHQKVYTSNYGKNELSETNYSLISSLKYIISDFNFKFSFRNEFSENIKYIPLFNFGVSKEIFENRIILKTNISNTNIKHETGNNAEISFRYLYGIKRNNKFNVTFYHSTINDMIQWIPENGVWTAENNKKVKISGIETNLKHNFNTGFLRHSLYASYTYTNALLTDVYSNEDFINSQKLVYTPENTAKLYIANSYKKFTISWATQYTGKRYITQENNEVNILPQYFLSNVYANYNIDIKHVNISFNAKFLNIFNKQNEMIKSYPASGRAFYFGEVFTKKEIQNQETELSTFNFQLFNTLHCNIFTHTKFLQT